MLEIYDVMGKLFLRESVTLTGGKFNGEFDHVLSEGMYLVRICTSQGCISQRMVISQ